MARKALVVLLLLLVGGLLGAPYYFGMQLEKLHAQQVEKAGSGQYQSQSLEYSRGWLKSVSRDQVRACSAAGRCLEAQVESVLHHGPIAITGILDGVAPLRPVQAAGVTRVRFDKPMQGATLKPALPEMNIASVIELDSSFQATLDMPASEHTVEGKAGAGKLSLGGVQGSLSGTAGTLASSGEFSLPSFKLLDEKGAGLTLAGLSGRYQGSFDGPAFSGKYDQTLQKLSVTDANDPQALALEQLTLSYTASASADGLAEGRWKGGLKTLALAGRSYGPGALEGESLRFNQAAMTRLQTDLRKLEAQNKPPEQLLPEMMALYQKGLGEVLKSRPEINLKSLSLKTPEGDLVTSLKLVGVPPQGDLNPAAWLSLLQADFSLQIPAVTLWNILDAQMQQDAQKAAAPGGQPAAVPTQDEIGARVDKLVKDNIFVPRLDANAYSLQAALLDGRLLINGQENPTFAALAGLLGGQTPGALPPGGDMQIPTPAP